MDTPFTEILLMTLRWTLGIGAGLLISAAALAVGFLIVSSVLTRLFRLIGGSRANKLMMEKAKEVETKHAMRLEREAKDRR